jgi:hypothetical protein
VAASGGTAVVSAPYHDVAANLNAGASYVFDQLDPVPAIAPLGLAVLGFTILAADARGLRRRGLRFDSLRT